MGLLNLPPEIQTRIVELFPRKDAFTWQLICRDSKDALQCYRNHLVTKYLRRNKLDLTHSTVRTSSPETFVAWTRAKPRKDDVIMERSHKLFYDFYQQPEGESREEEKVRKSNARLVLRHVRYHIGNDRFMEFFEKSVQDHTAWAMDVVSALSKDNEMEGDGGDDAEDENNRDHEFALDLGRAALKTLKSCVQRLHKNDDRRVSIQNEINEWAIEHFSNLKKSNYLAAARFAKSMLDYELTQGVGRFQMWANECLRAYSSLFSWSVVGVVDEGEFADSMLRTINKNFDCSDAQDWADRCFSIYARYGTPVHAITFARGMLALTRAHNFDTADSYTKWKQRCLDQERRLEESDLMSTPKEPPAEPR
jgi:hypothetical protein